MFYSKYLFYNYVISINRLLKRGTNDSYFTRCTQHQNALFLLANLHVFFNQSEEIILLLCSSKYYLHLYSKKRFMVLLMLLYNGDTAKETGRFQARRRSERSRRFLRSGAVETHLRLGILPGAEVSVELGRVLVRLRPRALPLNIL